MENEQVRGRRFRGILNLHVFTCYLLYPESGGSKARLFFFLLLENNRFNLFLLFQRTGSNDRDSVDACLKSAQDKPFPLLSRGFASLTKEMPASDSSGKFARFQIRSEEYYYL